MRYRFVSDDDGHEYIIPADRLSEWDEWISAVYEGETSYDLPEWAKEINSHTFYTFTDWKEE